MGTPTYANQWQWPLPATDELLDVSPYAPLTAPAENLAERLIMLAHLSFDVSVWGPETGRSGRYWPGFAERVEAATNVTATAAWWCALMQDLPGVPLSRTDLLHEKNLLVRPTVLSPPVPDADVLAVLRTYALDLTDRCRVWVRARRDLRADPHDVTEEA